MKTLAVTSLDRNEMFRLFTELNRIVECSEKHFRTQICKLTFKECDKVVIKGVTFKKLLSKTVL